MRTTGTNRSRAGVWTAWCAGLAIAGGALTLTGCTDIGGELSQIIDQVGGIISDLGDGSGTNDQNRESPPDDYDNDNGGDADAPEDEGDDRGPDEDSDKSDSDDYDSGSQPDDDVDPPGDDLDPPTDAPQWDEFALWQRGAQLRGANIYQRRVDVANDGGLLGAGPFGPPFAQSDFDDLAAQGANLVVISHSGLFAQSPPYDLDLEAQDNLDQLIAQIAAADMFAVIAFRSGPGRGDFDIFHGQEWVPPALFDHSVWLRGDIQDAWVRMWRYTAERYAGSSVVVGYDLMVEPNSNHVFFDQFDANRFYADWADTTYDWNQLHPRITAAIREVDAETPIIIEPMSYASQFWLPFVRSNADARTVYSVHQYEPFAYTHGEPPFQNFYPGVFDADYDGVAELVDRNWLSQSLTPIREAIAQGRVVAVTEFGAKRYVPAAATFIADELALFEELGVNHALWVWAPARRVAPGNDAFDPTRGPDPRSSDPVADNAYLAAIRANWARNTARPGLPAAGGMR